MSHAVARLGSAWFGSARLGLVRHGSVGQGHQWCNHGTEMPNNDESGLGQAWFGRAGLGMALQGSARTPMAYRTENRIRRIVASPGWAGSGTVRLGMAWASMTQPVTENAKSLSDPARRGVVRLGVVWFGVVRRGAAWQGFQRNNNNITRRI